MSRYSVRFVLGIMGLLAVGCIAGIDPTVDHPAGPSEPTSEPATSPTPVAPISTEIPTSTPFVTATIPAAVLDGDLPISGASYRIPLTIRHVTEETVTLFFELDRPTPASLFVHSEGQIIEAALAPDQTRHLVTIDGLIPDTGYRAVVAIEAVEDRFEQPGFLSGPWGPVAFQTASETGSLRIGVIGDASFGDPVTSELVAQMSVADLDFVLHAGDVVDETELDADPFQSYAGKFYTPFAPLLTQMPVYTVIGNHDYDSDIRWQDAPFYYYAFPPFPDSRFPGQEDRTKNQYYAFVYQDIQFLMLDTQTFFGQPGWEEQQAWFSERLADSTFRMTIPVLHVPPFGSSSVHPTDSLPVRNTWVPLFESAQVPLVISGHFHQYERLQKNGVTYLISGGGSSTLYAPGDMLEESVVFKRQSHYVMLEIDEQGMRLTAIGLGGEVLDQFSILAQ